MIGVVMIAFCDIIFQIVKDHSFSFLLLVQVARFDHFSQTSRIIVVLRLIVLIIARNPSKKKIHDNNILTCTTRLFGEQCNPTMNCLTKSNIMMYAVQRQAVGMICRSNISPRIISSTACNSSFVGGLIEQRRQINNSIPTIRTTAVQSSESKLLQQMKTKIQKTQRRTMMARSSSDVDPSTNPGAKAISFLVGTLGYEERIAKGVVDALKQSGVVGGPALLSMVRTLAGRWEVDEDAGLEALVESVTLEVARTENKKLIKVWIVPSSAWSSKESDADDDNDNDDTPTDLSRAFQVEGYEDMSLTDVAKFGDGDGAQVLGEMIECACSGIMACSTCHVVVANEWFDKVGEPSEAELDMIDLAYNAKSTSRLGCQVILKPELDNAIFKIPLGANNMMDFIPFEDD